ncbi:MAG TPA: glycosyltransferase [Gaiellaceae bacterium]|nr:glycosyltransferase [Gaiellaceae bacterium]
MQAIRALRRAGVDVVERHEPVWEGRRDAWRAGATAAFALARAELRLAKRVDGDFDAVLLGYPGHIDVAAARRASAGAPLVLNPLVSLSDTLVDDRRRFRPGSLAARMLAALDRRVLAAADVVVADTRAHAELFGALGARRCEVCLVGADERVFYADNTDREADVLFVGKLIPLHGVETILGAARLLPDARFRVVGSGQLDAALADRPPNVDWVPWIEYERLGYEYRRAGCALGVFGTSAKASRVIPNKAFHALACATPLVTADTPAARELLTDAVNARLVAPGSADALAAGIRDALGDADLGARGLAVYRERASEEVLADCWRGVVERAAP